MTMPVNRRLCIVTGATSGIGEAIARGLAVSGSDVILIGRNTHRGGQIALELHKRFGIFAKFEQADLSSRDSVRSLTTRIYRYASKVDVLVNCASGVFDRRRNSMDGIEYTLALNHLGPLLLTMLLEALLLAAPQARVITVAADPKILASQPPDPDDLEMHSGYSGIKAYMRSKNLNMLMTYQLAKRWEGSSVTANAYHPGIVRSGLAGSLGPLKQLLVKLASPFLLSPEQGADTGVWLASDPSIAATSGRFYIRRQEVQSAPHTYDEGLATRIWCESLDRIGLGIATPLKTVFVTGVS